MTQFTILEYPDERLRKPGKTVDTFDADLKTLVADMFETMYEHDGVGLAATQINIQKRLFIMDVSPDKSDQLVFINPEITPTTNTSTEINEGCLSIPGVKVQIDRPKTVKIKAQNVNGEWFEMELDGLMSVCVQHENDHLDGKLFVDYLSRLKRERIKKKIEKQHKTHM